MDVLYRELGLLYAPSPKGGFQLKGNVGSMLAGCYIPANHIDAMVYFTDPGKCATWRNLRDAIVAQSYPVGVEAFDFKQLTAITELVQAKMMIQDLANKGDFNASGFLKATWSNSIRAELAGRVSRGCLDGAVPRAAQRRVPTG